MTRSSTSSSNLKNVFRFLKRTLVFAFAFVLAMMLALLLTGWGCQSGRLGTAYKKHARLEALSSPKMVLVGGSNLHYSINSKMLQDSIDIPVVNMGIQQSIGLQYMFDEVKESLCEGDILMVLIQPSSYIGMPIEGQTNIARIASIYPKGIRHLNAKQCYNAVMFSGVALIQNFRDMQVALSKKLRGKPTFYESCDEFGDYHGHKGKASQFKSRYRDFTDDKFHDNGILPLIDHIQKYVEQKNARVLIGFTPSAKSMSDSLFFGKIQMKLPPEIVVGNMSDYILPDAFFFDSPKHLIYSKRDMRTQMLIQDLREYKATNDLHLKGNY